MPNATEVLAKCPCDGTCPGALQHCTSLSMSCCTASAGVGAVPLMPRLLPSLCENPAAPDCRVRLRSVKEQESPVHAVSRASRYGEL